MGTSHSRTRELNDNASQLRRHCFWCQNRQSFDDFYESVIITTVYDKKKKADSQHFGACFKNTRRVKSKCRKMSKDSLAPTNLLKGPMTSNFEQWQQNRKSANCVMKINNDASDNCLLYSYLSHDSLIQGSSSNVDNDSKTKSCHVLLTRRLIRDDRSLSSNDEEKCQIMNPVQVNMMYGSKCTVGMDYNSLLLDDSNYKTINRRKSRCKISAIIMETKGTIEKLALASADTMAITAVPLDCWLKERLKKWVQLSGHEGTIVPATDKTLWKRQSCSNHNERNAYRVLMNDAALQTFVPRYYREVKYENDSYIEIEDLTALFDDPAIMDIKMGTRTFLESEVNSKTVRNDLYKKMVSLDPYEPTEEEHAAKAITKTRYMQFREKESSTATLGYRIEAAKMPGGVLQKSFKKVKMHEDIRGTLLKFFGQHTSTAGFHILQRLKRLREAVQKSLFFRTHEVIGSSLLLIYDATYANVWMIDFAKSIPVEIDSINHRREWVFGNHEDGYFVGLDNLIEVMEELVLL